LCCDIIDEDGSSSTWMCSMGNTFRQKATRRGKHTRGFYNHLIQQLSKKARHRGLAWMLEPELVLKLIKQPCYLCGAPPSNRFKSLKRGTWEGRVIIYQGIDRVNNKLGYVEGNVKPCCKKCNMMKVDSTLSGLKKHIQKIIKWNGNGISFGSRKPLIIKVGSTGKVVT
jgi:hypothetical protein